MKLFSVVSESIVSESSHGVGSAPNVKKPRFPARVMSGMRTTGSLHIGHYFGSLINWLKFQNEHPCFFGAMDWHGMTSQYKTTEKIDPQIRDMIAEWVAWGIDPEKHTVFVQSRVPEHLEIFMILANLTPMGWLERVNTWKDEIDNLKQQDAHNLGRFFYPVLQTADIVAYRGTHVPVGKDQVPHLELSREITRRFNHLYDEVLPEPQSILTETPLIPGSDGRKMSKSYDNFIPLTEDAKPLESRLKKMPTDPARVRRHDVGDPAKCPVFDLHKLFSTAEDRVWVTQGCTTAGIGCGDCKMRLFSNMNALMEKPRGIKKELLQDTKRLDSIIAQGCDKARGEAQKSLQVMRKAMKFTSGDHV